METALVGRGIQLQCGNCSHYFIINTGVGSFTTISLDIYVCVFYKYNIFYLFIYFFYIFSSSLVPFYFVLRNSGDSHLGHLQSSVHAWKQLNCLFGWPLSYTPVWRLRLFRLFCAVCLSNMHSAAGALCWNTLTKATNFPQDSGKGWCSRQRQDVT